MEANFKEIVERLKFALDVKTNTNLAKKLDVPYATLNTWLKRNSIPFEMIITNPKLDDISMDWLFGKVGYEMILPSKSNGVEVEPTIINITTRKQAIKKLIELSKQLNNTPRIYHWKYEIDTLMKDFILMRKMISTNDLKEIYFCIGFLKADRTYQTMDWRAFI
jgi:hypothetical protein